MATGNEGPLAPELPNHSSLLGTCKRRDPNHSALHPLDIECIGWVVSSGVHNPVHYGGADNPYEHVKVAEALGWVGNAFIYNCTKYLWRYGKKDPTKIVEDLEKARWYLDREIKRLKG